MLTRRNIVRVIVAIVVLVATWAMLGTVVAQKAAAPKPQDKLALGEPEVTVAAPYGYQQERQNLQARVDEVHGSGVRQTGQGQERAVGRQGTNPIEITCKSSRKRGELTAASRSIRMPSTHRPSVPAPKVRMIDNALAAQWWGGSRAVRQLAKSGGSIMRITICS